MPRVATTPMFQNLADGSFHNYMMFHMGQNITGCPFNMGGKYGSIGLDYSDDGAVWIPYTRNPVLKDLTWTAFGFAPGSSMEKGEPIVTPGGTYTYYMMAFVPTVQSGYENSLTYCTNHHSLTYLLGSQDAVQWVNLGRVSAGGLVAPPESCPGSYGPNPYGPWLLNCIMAYDPNTNDIYVTRSYATQPSSPANPFPLPNRVQVYKVANGVQGVLTGSWQLLIDVGCDSTEPFQQSMPGFRPDSASIVHDGLGNVVFFNTNQIMLELGTNGQVNDGGDCFISAQLGTYEVLIGP